MLHNSYEKMTFYKTPRGRSKKIRKYANVDLSKEFEYRQAQREKRKMEKLEDLYKLHDIKALGLKDLVAISDKERSEMNEEELAALQQQEDAQRVLLQ